MKGQMENVAETEIKKLITRAQGATEDELAVIRKELIGDLKKFGARTFVDTTEDLLDEEFQLEGCNDPRIPLESIFTVSLSELEDYLDRKELELTSGHPISGLFREHVTNVDRLQALKRDFEVGGGESIDKLKYYYKKLDLHALKEEQALFPKLEERGLRKYTETSREEHEVLKEDLVGVIKLVQDDDDEYRVAEKRFTEDFIPVMSKHLFRESFILYPSASDYIQDEQEWEKLERELGVMDKLAE